MLFSGKHIAALCIGPSGRMELRPSKIVFRQLHYNCKTGLFDICDLDTVRYVAVGG